MNNLNFTISILISTLAFSFCHSQDRSQSRVTKSFAEPIRQSIVASTEVGVIDEVLVEEGDLVSVGQTLAVIEHKVLLQDERIALAKSESSAELEAAQSKMNLLAAQKDTLEKLYEDGHVNKYELEQKQTEFENSVAQYNAAKNRQHLSRLEVERIRARINQRKITSPIDGYVTAIHKQLGEHVSHNEPQYATVVCVEKLRVRFYLDENSLDQITVGQLVGLTVGKNAQRKQAEITFISPTIDADSGTGRVDVIIDNADEKIRSGTVCYWLFHEQQERTAQGHVDKVRN